jgi:hypothetical protein
MPATSSVARAGRIARLASIALLAGCVGEIGETNGTAPPDVGSGGTARGGSSVATGIGGNDSTGTGGGAGAAGTGNDLTGTGGAGANAGDGAGGATGGGAAGTSDGAAGRGGSSGGATGGAGPAARGGAGGTAGRGGAGGGAAGRGGTTGTGGGTGGDPFSVAPKCTSGTMWTQANRGSSDMNPGRACIACHSTMNGPALTIAGTVYPTAHEPDLCNGANGSNGARVVITGADGQTLTLTPGTSGNFNSRTAVKTPFKAKVTYMGRERAMAATQTSGDCNSCHTQNGTNSAPGRILLP